MTTFIPMPIVTGGAHSGTSMPLPDWLNITLFTVLSIIISGAFFFLIYEMIDCIKEREIGVAIIVGILSLMLPMIELIMIWEVFGR